jgi:archaellum biogenesis ATPase FlaH
MTDPPTLNPVAQATPRVEPLEVEKLNFDGPATPLPRLIGPFPPTGVVAINGHAGTIKTWLAMELAVALIRDRTWLGRSWRDVREAPRVIYVDAENGTRRARSRLYALGMSLATEQECERLIYAPMQGVAFGGEDAAKRPWLSRLESLIVQHRPAVVVIDSLAATCAVDHNDNGQVAQLMAILKRYAEQWECLFFLIAHDRKSGGARDPDGLEMSGAAQWRNQLDAQASLSFIDTYADGPDDTGVESRRTRCRLTWTKDRDGHEDPRPLLVTLETMSEDSALTLAEIRAETYNDAAAGSPSRPAIVLDQAAVALRAVGGPLGRQQLADAVGLAKDNGTLKSALTLGGENGTFASRERGEPYTLAPDPPAF